MTLDHFIRRSTETSDGAPSLPNSLCQKNSFYLINSIGYLKIAAKIFPVENTQLPTRWSHYCSLCSQIRDLNSQSCPHCKSLTPLAGNIPIISKNHELFVLNWVRDYQSFLKKIDSDIDRLKSCSPLISTQQAKGKISNYRKNLLCKKKIFEKILAPWLAIDLKEIPLPLRSSVNLDQYYENILRDWSSDVDPTERTAYFEIAIKLLNPLLSIKKILIVGAGPARIAFDLAIEFPDIQFLATDIHPFLLGIGNALAHGAQLEAPEFPLAPLSDEHSKLHALKNSEKIKPKNLQFAILDFFENSNLAEPVDLIITPWLVDIVDSNFLEFSLQVKKYLKPNGYWLNFGTFFFQKQKIENQISRNECAEFLESLDFRIQNLGDFETPYLQSKLSGHKRFESVFYFLAEYIKTQNPNQFLENNNGANQMNQIDSSTVIKLSEKLLFDRDVFIAEAQLLSLFDGKRSFSECIQQAEKLFGMTQIEAKNALLNYLKRKGVV